MNLPIFTFDTTHHALWSEELARDAGIPHAVVPAPSAANARCSIALEVLAPDAARFREILRSSGVDHRVYDTPDE